MQAYFFNYVEKGLAEIDGEKKGSLLQKLNAKLSFLSNLKSTFRARFDGDLIKKFYVDHASVLNEAQPFDSAGKCSKAYLSLFKAFEEAGNKDRRVAAVKLDKFSNTEVVCDSSDVFSAKQVDELNYRISLGKQGFLYDQLKSELHLRENHLGAHVKALMESEQYSDLRPIHRDMYLYAAYMAKALNSDKYQATRLLNFSYDRLYSLMNSDIANFLNQHQHMDVAKLNQFLTKQCLKYQTVLESTMMSCLLAAPSAALREGRDGWLVANTDSTMWMVSKNNMTGRLTCVRNSFEGLALDRPKVVQRLNALQELTKERLMRYEMDYKQENLGELVRAVIGGYAMGRWRWRSHFKGHGQDFLYEYRDLLNKSEMTVEDKKALLKAVQLLQIQVYMSQGFSLNSSFSIRLAFLERRLVEQLSYEFNEGIEFIIAKLAQATAYEGCIDILQEMYALKTSVLSVEMRSHLFIPFHIDFECLERQLIEKIEKELNKTVDDIENKLKRAATREDKSSVLERVRVLKDTVLAVNIGPNLVKRLESLEAKVVQLRLPLGKNAQGVEMEGTREALMMQSVLSQPAVQAESALGYSS
ncbi:hypothetical protein A0O36_02266 [Piscirickettsiaceae bacterium NZ-RLO1]|nr:hypothetical protein A0O36_02266 [Piscirickettsiaceae bacterium NZ-RLO1]